MKSVLLLGLGRFGRYMAQRLESLGHEVLAVDKDEQRVNEALAYVTNAVIGDATSEAFLRTLGVSNFDLCVVGIGEDFESSIEATSLLKDGGAPYVLSRASTDLHAKLLLRVGADKVIYPIQQAADYAAVRYTTDHILEYMALDEDHAIYETPVPAAWLGKTILELNVRARYGVNVLGIKREGRMQTMPGPDHRFAEGETMLIMSRKDALGKLMK